MFGSWRHYQEECYSYFKCGFVIHSKQCGIPDPSPFKHLYEEYEDEKGVITMEAIIWWV